MSETRDLPLHRRGFLAGAAVTSLGVAQARAETQPVAQGAASSPAPAPAGNPLPGYVSWKDAEALIVHSNQTIETRRAAFGTGLITDESVLYVRNNVSPPPESIVADRDAWAVEIKGVTRPGTITVGALKRLGLVTVATVLQCSGNGRKYFQDTLEPGQKMSGTAWTVGAAGCVLWTGVPLRTVIEAMGGPVADAKFITGTGGEEIPQGLKPKDIMVERSVPLATLDTVILAWALNGKPISLAHGGPLRMIVPGYSGVNNIKYVKTVALTATETDAKIQAASYRIHKLGEKAAPNQPPVWEQPVRSWITAPLKDGRAGPMVIAGVAFGGVNAVAGVEVSADGGATWHKADFVGPDLGRFAWRLFALPIELPEGTHVLVSRARDTAGNIQPEDVPVNGGGYSHNGWRGPAVTLNLA
ncbi:SorT family sulfite dehydrogenase catalytic subunit [Methylobacterium goesingense]|uniref:Sulfite oxidase n=1 Tax=Methylobacterium goesingense TaxID=243690 RepID=A0ABV2KZP0_9HYPH|nr:sulfite oxidase [Methylobacterium goesingense]GJD73083.1 Protein-methionine-sulfoxide reductase catalytic subunit MsrP [Methylobacterium goesingense]